MKVKSYRDLTVWRLSIELVVRCYAITATFPKCELFGLSSQIRRAAVSIPSNIAEGQSRGYTREYIHHLAMARGSVAELETQLQIAFRLGYIDENALVKILRDTDHISRKIYKLKKALRKGEEGVGGLGNQRIRGSEDKRSSG